MIQNGINKTGTDIFIVKCTFQKCKAILDTFRDGVFTAKINNLRKNKNSSIYICATTMEKSK